MKIRRFPALLALLMILSLWGCASKPSSQNSKASAAKSAKSSKSTKSAEQLLSQMTLEEKVGQVFLIEPDQLDPAFGNEKNYKYWRSLSPQGKRTLQRYQAGGYILFGGNIKSKSQLRKLNAQLMAASKIPPFIAVDEEGGRVTRLARTPALQLENVGSMESIGASDDLARAEKAGEYIGSYLCEYGISWDFAPVADVNTNPQNRVIGDRAFGSDPEKVGRMASAFLDGLHRSGVKGCIKHFPGHGDTKDDTHDDFVRVDKSWEELKGCELIPFVQNLDKADAVMVAHVTMQKASGDGLPASLSKNMITEKLRGELGYKGIILTDSLGMGAIKKHYDSGQAAIMAFEAGNDIILMPAEFFRAYDAFLDAAKNGIISGERLDESVLRILKFKGF